MDISELIQVSTTCDDRSVLASIAEGLVGKRLAACCQLEGPVGSTYSWNGAIENSAEYRMLIKTRRNLFAEVEAEILAQHSYETPQITAVKIVECSADFRRWLEENTRES